MIRSRLTGSALKWDGAEPPDTSSSVRLGAHEARYLNKGCQGRPFARVFLALEILVFILLQLESTRFIYHQELYHIRTHSRFFAQTP